MQDHQNMLKAIEAFDAMSVEYRQLTLLKLLEKGTVNILEAVSTFGTYLEQYKRNAKHDMYMLSEAGLSLGEATIKKIPTMKKNKTSDPRALAIAQTHTLLSAGGYYGTPFAKRIASYADLKEVDPKWYEQYWKLKQPLVEQEPSNDHTE